MGDLTQVIPKTCSPFAKWVCVVVGLMLHAPTAQAVFHWGRDVADQNRILIAPAGGMIFGLDGEVQETTRPIGEIGGPWSGSAPENYSWRELGFDQRFSTVGVKLERKGRFISWHNQFVTGSPSASGVADRDYFIGVGRIRLGGRTYGYMAIPEGQAYQGEIDLYGLDTRFLISPVSFNWANGISLVPFLQLGAKVFVADYEIDAGPGQQVIQYENPPRNYVVGGKGRGTRGLLVPELGIGLDLELPLMDRLHLELQGHAAFLRVRGNNSAFGVFARNEKVVDVDYMALGGRAILSWAMNRHMDLIAGVEFQYINGDTEIRATEKSEEEILELREKFDKDATFKLSTLMGFIGFRF